MAGGNRSAHAGVAISTVLHLCIIVALGYWLVGGKSKASTVVLSTSWSADSARPLSLVEHADSSELSESRSGGTSLGTVSFVPSVTRSPAEVVAELDVPAPEYAAMSLTDVDLTAPVQPLSGLGEDATLGSGAGTGSDTGDGTGTDFFGLNAPGRKFVFVVDASGSMNRHFDGPGKTLLGRVKLELLKCVSQMSPEQQFFIVFFNEEAHPMPANRLMDATPDAQRYYLRWMAGMKATGMTEPESALLLALRLDPDVIYFLTDGAFKYRVIDRVHNMNRGRVTIHTVGFGDKTGFGGDGAERFMQMIADQNGGTYQFVSAAAAGAADGNAADETAEEPARE